MIPRLSIGMYTSLTSYYIHVKHGEVYNWGRHVISNTYNKSSLTMPVLYDTCLLFHFSSNVKMYLLYMWLLSLRLPTRFNTYIICFSLFSLGAQGTIKKLSDACFRLCLRLSTDLTIYSELEKEMEKKYTTRHNCMFNINLLYNRVYILVTVSNRKILSTNLVSMCPTTMGTFCQYRCMHV